MSEWASEPFDLPPDYGLDTDEYEGKDYPVTNDDSTYY